MIVEVERKWFVIVWTRTAGRSSLITEKLRKKEFRRVPPKDDGAWPVVVLRLSQEKLGGSDSSLAGSGGSSGRDHHILVGCQWQRVGFVCSLGLPLSLWMEEVKKCCWMETRS